MFSVITKQINSWVESKTNNQMEQDSQSSENNSANSPENKKESNSTKDMLLKMRNEIDGWLGIKNNEKEEVIFEQPRLVDDKDTIEKLTDDLPVEQNDKNEDPEITPITEISDITPDKIDDVSNKAFDATKSFGNLLFSALNVAGSKIMKTFEDSTFLNEFMKEQDSFINNKQTTDASVPPWTGHNNEDVLKEECLNLSNDRRNFLRNTPSGVDFYFNYDVSYPVALATMAEDPKLEKMRFELVPKLISEEKFWRNYFYRVSLIRQAHELSYMNEERNDKEYQEKKKKNSDVFISDNFERAYSDIDQIDKDAKRLTVQETIQQEWEKELEEELADYETMERKVEINNIDSDKDIDALLNKEENI